MASAATPLVTQADLRAASKAGNELLHAIAHSESALWEQRAVMSDRCARAFTLLWRVCDIARRGVVCRVQDGRCGALRSGFEVNRGAPSSNIPALAMRVFFLSLWVLVTCSCAEGNQPAAAGDESSSAGEVGGAGSTASATVGGAGGSGAASSTTSSASGATGGTGTAGGGGSVCAGQGCPACEILATGQSMPKPVAVSPDWVVWGNMGDGTVMKVPKAGGPPQLIAAGQADPFAVAVDDLDAFWITDKLWTVMKAPLGGGPVTTLASGEAGIAIAVDDANVYWASNLFIKSVPKAGGAPLTLAPADGGGIFYPILFERDGYLYSTDDSGDPSSPRVVRAPKTGGPVETLATGQSTAYAVVADANSVYWANTYTGVIHSQPLAGGAPVVLATVPPPVNFVLVDEAFVYWASTVIGKVPLAGGAPITLAAGAISPFGLAVDETHVYFSNYCEDGTILRAAK